MTVCERLSIEDKIKYFRQSDLLARRADNSDEAFGDDDSLDEEEKALRRECRRFHAGSDIPVATPARAPSPEPQPDPSPPTTSHSSQVFAQAKERPLGRSPKRVTSAPLATTIQATPASEHRRRAARTLVPSTSFIAETPLAVPDSVAGPRHHHLLRRSETTPLPAKRGFFGPGQDCSPSLGLPMKKRKRGGPAQVKLVAEAERVFAGLRFFYIPDDDVAPARRARITKAREYGACWTKDVGDATHVVVDRRLGYADIEGILGARTPPSDVVVVYEEFPLDCISYRRMLNPHQAKYQVTGHPGQTCGAAESEPTAGRAVEKNNLALKPPPANSKRWDHLPNVGTPSRDSGPSQQGAGGLEEPARPLPQTITISDDDSQPRTAHVEPSQGHHNPPEDKTEPRQDAVGDELSGYINMMQKYRALPLDDEHEDDDHRSTSGTTTTASPSTSDEGAEDEHRSGSEAEAIPPKRAKKVIPLEERFACYQGGTLGAPSTSSPNARTIEVLQEMCTYYSRINDQWRTLSYRRAIRTLQRQPSLVRTAEEARRLPGIGDRLALKIEEIAATDRLRRLEHANAEPLDRALQLFLGVYDVGLSQANRWVAQGLRTLEDLLGPRARLTRNQRIGVERYADLSTRIPRREVEAVGEIVRAAARKIDPGVELIIGGSYRRGAETSGDVDFVVTRPGTLLAADLAPFLATLVRDLERSGFLVATLASSRSPGGGGGGGTVFRGCCALPAPHPPTWRRIDLLVVPEPELGAALLYFTGNDVFNRSMRLLASKKGMRLNQRGLYEGVMRGPGREKIGEGRLVEGRDERRIFEVLGVRWREPWERWC